MLPTRPLMGSAPRFEYPKQGERRPPPLRADSSARTRLGCFFRLRALIECRLAQCGRRRAGGGATLGTGSETRRLPTASSGWPWRERSCSLRRMRYVHDRSMGFLRGELGARGGRDRGRRAGPGRRAAPGRRSRHRQPAHGRAVLSRRRVRSETRSWILRSGDQCRRPSGSRRSRGPVTRKRTTPD